MINKYQPQNFEKKWVEIWEKEKVYQTSQQTNKPKQYVLSMFPYPSGAGLHVGHVRIYTGTDVLARFFRMNGYPVLHPMGWDAFGLPAENAAIKAKKNPMEMVPQNIANFKRQMKMLGFSYDWEKEFSTTGPEYYKWTQWLFIQFFKMGLLYKKEIPVYYCPSCKTGLAEEEVLPDGTHERCQKPITRKTLPQWLFRITTYADKLLEDLKDLDWPEGILEMQKNWIGKSEGTEIKFKVQSSKFKVDYIKVFTTRPDTLFGVMALVVAPEHWLIEEIQNSKFKIQKDKLKEIKNYVQQAKRKLDLARTDLTKEKTGVDTGLKAIHPLTGEEIPIWVADYVVGWYGEGAVMVVPAHDQRDFEFAKKFGLPIKKVVKPLNIFQSVVIKKSVEGEFCQKVKELGMEVKDYQKWGYKISGFKDNLERYIKLLQKNLKSGPWYSDIDGCVSLVIFKEKIFNLPEDDTKAKKYAEDILRIPKKQLDWQSPEHYHYCFPYYGILINSGEFDGLISKEAIKKITEKLQSLNLGKKTVQYKLRDWIFSRQRYWGEPIPMVYCEKCAKNKTNYWLSEFLKNKPKAGVFIDDANMFYGQKKAKWRIDYGKLHSFISQVFEVKFLNYYLTIPLASDSAFIKTQDYLNQLKNRYGNLLIIKSKPLKYIYDREQKRVIKKGNIDGMLIADVLSLLDEIDVVIVLSGDSDFADLILPVIKKRKKILFMGFVKNMAWELRQRQHIYFEKIRLLVEAKNKNAPDWKTGVPLLLKLYHKELHLSRANLFGWFPIAEDELPLKLPYIKSYEPTETGESPLAKIKEFVNTTCPNCGRQAKRETDTMPNWAGSCWYFIRFAQNQKSKIKNQKLEEEWKENTVKNDWLPVDWYLGGAEHAVLHLLYSRFWVKALYNFGLLDFSEPFLRLRNVGMVLAEDHRKMSKSFGNVINPDDVVAEYGADTLRLYEMFMAPFSQEVAWSTDALQGCFRFLKRVWEIYHSRYQISNIKNQNDNEKCKMEGNKELEEQTFEVEEEQSDGKTSEVKLVAKLNKTIKKVTEDVKQIKFNTAIAAMMEFVNEWEDKIQNLKGKMQSDKEKLKMDKSQNLPLSVDNAKKFLQILAPFAPFLTEEIWREVFGEKTSIHLSTWPEAEKTEEEEVIIPVQVNGKLRATIKVQSSRLRQGFGGQAKLKVKSYLEKEALKQEKVKKYLEGKKYKIIYVEGRVVNFVVLTELTHSLSS